MQRGTSLETVIVVAAALVVVAGTAQAVTVYETEDPFGGFTLIGFDVFEGQQVGLRFTPQFDATLDEMGLWFMNNDFSGTHFDEVTITLRDDAVSPTGGSIPGGTVFEKWSFTISAVGWDPQLETVQSVAHPLLEAGTNYWVVAEADVPPFTNPVWNTASEGLGFMAFTEPDGSTWQDGGTSGVASIVVEGTPALDSFDLAVSEPTFGGDVATLTVSGAKPNSDVFLALSAAGLGETVLAQLGVVLDLAAPQQAGPRVRTDANGFAEWTIPVPDSATGRTAYFQAAQEDGVSQVQVREIN